MPSAWQKQTLQPTDNPAALAAEGSELSRPVSVRSVFDGYYGDLAIAVIDAVDHAIVTPPGAV